MGQRCILKIHKLDTNTSKNELIPKHHAFEITSKVSIFDQLG